MLNGNALNVDAFSSSFRISLLGIVIADTCLEGFSALTETEMLNAHMNTFWDDTSVYALVHDNTNGVSRNVEYSSSLAMVELVRHASLDRTICNYVNIIALFIVDEVSA